MDTIIVPGPTDIAWMATDMVEEVLTRSPNLMLGLAGGTTPMATHRELATRNLDWAGITAWITDERWVPAKAQESNQRMARETLTEATGIELLAPDTAASNPARSARDFADIIVPALASHTGPSVVMLGIGEDGHTASLFPGTRALGFGTASYVANFVPQMDCWRLTSTLGLLAEADIVLFLVSGAAKAETVRDIASGTDLPAARVSARERVAWILDEDAAHLL